LLIRPDLAANVGIADLEQRCGHIAMNKGQQAWIRVRGAPDDPESFDLATWNGIVWLIPRTNSLGDIIHIQIHDYMVAETMPATSKPQDIYKPLINPDDKHRK
jgi:hypothetical protein